MKKIYFPLILLLILSFGCKKKGHIDIKNLSFWANNCTPPYEIQFNLDVSYQPDEVSYHWDFGDGQTSTERQPVHLYSESGNYTAKVTIVNYKTTVEKSILVDVSSNPMPIQSQFEYEINGNNNYVPCEIMFYNNSQYASKFEWDFGDSTFSNETQPTHFFEEAGTYNVYLNAICNNDTATSVSTITILPPPDKISIDEVTVWLPPNMLGGLFDLEYAVGNMNETPIDLDFIEPHSFPMTWFINEDLFFFDGNYNAEQLYFRINDVRSNGQKVYSFSTRFQDIQADNYPNTLIWDNGQDFSAKVVLSYGFSKKRKQINTNKQQKKGISKPKELN